MGMTALAVTSPYAVAPRLKNPAQALWTELRFAPEPVDELDLLVAAVGHCEDARPTRGATLKLLETLLGRWVSARLVDVVDGKPPRYSLERNCLNMASPPLLPAPTRRNPLPRRNQRQRLWSAMRVLRSFDLTTLIIAAEANPRSARDMIDVLERGGWLVRTADGWSTAAARRWGPLAPTWSRGHDDGHPVVRVTDNRDGTLITLRGRRGPRRERPASRPSDGGVS